jgi:hypothetical protein
MARNVVMSWPESKMNKITTLAMIISCLSRCSDLPTKNEIIGTYSANHQGARAKLSLYENYKYKQSFEMSDGSKLEEEGTWWIYDKEPSEIRVVIDSFRPIFSIEKSAEWSTPAQKTWLGHMQLCDDWDLGYCYVKQ